MRKNRIDIAVIDDGINEKLYGLEHLRYNIEIFKDLTIRERKDYNAFLSSHGTTCGAIINKYASDAFISSVKILDDKTGKAESGQLVAALEWCVENSIKIVNMSLGTIDFRDFEKVRTCVNSAVRSGLIVVAACNNKNVFTYPACLSNVIGICAGKIYSGDQYKFNEYAFDGIDILASARHYLEDIFGNAGYTEPSNSFAAPMITARICNIFNKKQSASFEETKKELFKSAVDGRHTKYNPYLYINADWIQNAAVVSIDCNDNITCRKENYEFSAKKPVIIRLNEGNSEKIPESIEQKMSQSSYDLTGIKTVVLDISAKLPVSGDTTLRLIKYFKDIGKNVVFIYDSANCTDSYLKLEQEGIRIWHPSSYIELLNRSLRKSCHIDIPIIALYGFCDIQQSYILDCLNSLFRKEGYYSVGVANTCKGILNGLEYLPKCINAERYLSNIYKKYNCDIILLGADMGSIDEIYFSKIEIDVKIIGINENELIDIGGDVKYDDANCILFKYKMEITDDDIKRLYERVIVLLKGDCPS